MLQHEEQTAPPMATPSTGQAAGEPAAQVRVTAEEFARAVTRYQARREQAAQRMEGTVAIGDAVHELGLEATPEEILAEVWAERTAQEQQAAQAVTRQVSHRFSRIIAAVVATGALLLVGTGLFFAPMAPTNTPGGTPAVQIHAVTASPFVTMSAPPTVLAQDNSGSKPILKTLAEVGDNVPVRCALEMTDARAAFANFSNQDTSWTLIKHDGRLYIKGWIANMSPQAISMSTVNIYSQAALVPSGFAPTPITVRADGFQTNPALGSADMIVAEHVLPDSLYSGK